MDWENLRPYTGIDIRDFTVMGFEWRLSEAFTLTGNELYKQIYRTTNRFDPNNVELCISQIGEVKKDGLFTRVKRDMEVLDILQQGDTGTYNPQIIHLHLEHYKEIWYIVQQARELIEGRYVFGEYGEGMLEPTFEQMERGANILKPVYDKYQEFEFDAKFYKDSDRMPRFVYDFFKLCETAKIFWDDDSTQIARPKQVPQKRKGAPNKSNKDIRDCIQGEDKSLIERLKHLTLNTDGSRKRGNAFYLYIGVCVKEGYMLKPTYGQIKAEFGNVGSQSGYNRYMSKQNWTEAEHISIKNAIEAGE